MTLAGKAYDLLRHDIVSGALAPGQPLRMAQLSARYAMGFSPIREALSRLQAERLVVSVALRGFTVAPLSAAELADTTRTRIFVEAEALRLAIVQGDDAWEAGIVSALHALQAQTRRAADAGDGAAARAVEDRHRAFHAALIAACGSAWLLDFSRRLYAEAERYRFPALMGAPGRDVGAEHAALAEAALARDAGRACALLADHYTRTAEAVAPRLAAMPQARRA